MSKIKLLVILGSVRKGRRGRKVADWFLGVARSDERFEIIFEDLASRDLPLFMEEIIPGAQKEKNYELPQTQEWSKVVDNAEAYILITPEYNHGYPAALKNAIDHVYFEWKGKPVGFVGYGSAGAGDSIAALKSTVKALDWTQVEPRVAISKVWEAFDLEGNLAGHEEHEQDARRILDAIDDELA